MREWRLKVPVFASSDPLNFTPFARTFFHCIRRVSCLGFVAQFTLTIYRYLRPIRFLTTRLDHVFRSSRLIRSIRVRIRSSIIVPSSNANRQTTVRSTGAWCAEISLIQHSTTRKTYGFHATNSCHLSIFFCKYVTRDSKRRNKYDIILPGPDSCRVKLGFTRGRWTFSRFRRSGFVHKRDVSP